VFLRQELFGHPARLLRVGLVRDVVALEDAPCSMSRYLHDHRLGNPGAAQIPDSGAPQIVKQESGDARSGAREGPTFAKGLDRVRATRKVSFRQGCMKSVSDSC